MKEIKFKKGQVIKNAKDLCKCLNKTYDNNKRISHNTKISCENELNRYCEWHKEGQKYIIDKVFKIVKGKVDGRKNNRGADIRNRKSNIYGDYIENLVSKMLNEELIDDTNIFTFSSIFTNYIPLLNKDEWISMYNYNEYAKNNGIRYKGMVREYYLHLKDKLKTQLEKSLNHLQNKGYITWSKEYIGIFSSNPIPVILNNKEYVSILKESEKWVQENILDEKGNKKYTQAKRVNEKVNRNYKKEVIKVMNDISNEKEINIDNCFCEDDLFNWYTAYCIKPLIKNDIPFKEVDISEINTIFILQMHKCLFSLKEKKGYLTQPITILDIVELENCLFTSYNEDRVTEEDLQEFNELYEQGLIEQEYCKKSIGKINDEIGDEEVIIFHNILIDDFNTSSTKSTEKYLEQDKIEGIPF